MLINNNKLKEIKFKTSDNLFTTYNSSYFDLETLSLTHVELRNIDEYYCANAKDIRYSKIHDYFIINKNSSQLKKIHYSYSRQNPQELPTSYIHNFEIKSSDGFLGNGINFFLDPATLEIKYFLCEIQASQADQWAYIPTKWIEQIDWENKVIHLKLDFETVTSSFNFPQRTDLTDEIEARLESKSNQLQLHYSRSFYYNERVDPW